MKAGVVAVLLVVLSAGCAEPVPDDDVPDIAWGPMDVMTTASEPFEQRGFIRVDWADGVFAIQADREVDMPRFLQRDGDLFYSSRGGAHWIEHPLSRVEGTRALSDRVVVWDLPRLVSSADTTFEDGVLRGTTTVRWFAQDKEVSFEVQVEEGRAVAARVEAEASRESPFTFTAASEGLPFAGDHAPSRPFDEVDALDRDARAGHQQIIRLIQDHVSRTGSPPDEVDEGSLAVELALSGESWPRNPYDDEAMRDAEESGHYFWDRCGDNNAAFVGHGWDVGTTFLVFGSGCPLPS